jgi:hypothetical protein
MYPLRTWNQPIWATGSMLSGSFVSPVRNQLSAAYVGCSFGLSKVSVEMDQKPLTPWSTNMAAVQMGNSLDFVALRAKVSRAAAQSVAYADG